MAGELIQTNAAALAALVDKTTGDTLTAAEYTTLKDSVQEANTATRTANTVFAGPTTGAAAAPTFRPLVAADIPSLSAVYLPIGGGTLTGALVLSGAPTVDLHAATKLYVDGIISALSATNLTSGTVPDARFPATLPAISGANLTALNPANLSAAVPTTKGGTGLTAIGTGLQVLRVNAGATALEFADAAGGISGLGIGRIPQASSGTAIVDSKMLTSGTNSGTWTLYDDTAVTGKSTLVIRNGPGQAYGDTLLSFQNNAGSEFGYFKHDTINGGLLLGAMDIRDPSASVYVLGANNPIGLGLAPTAQVRWGAAAPYIDFDVGLVRGGAAGILKVTDGSTGFGSLRASALGTETANGAISNVKSISESITLSTAGATTDSTADLLPANAIIKSVVARITTTITTATDWALGDATTAARFAAANSTLTAGTTAVGVAHRQGSVATDAAGPVQIAAAKLRITTTGTPGAGVIRVTVFYEELTPPTS